MSSTRKPTTHKTQAQSQEDNSRSLTKLVLKNTKAILSKRNYEYSINLTQSNHSVLMEKKIQDEMKESKNSSFEKILPREFYLIDSVTLARNLLGKILVRKVEKQVIKCRIVETEAYCGSEDKGCHAYGDKFSEKTKYLYQEGGHLCVSFLYGNSCCLCITADVKSEPAGVLIRAVEVLEGLNHVISNRNMKNPSILGKELVNGPGKVCIAMRIDPSHNTHDVTQGSEIYFIEGDDRLFETVVSKRINIDYAEEYKDKPWRFYIKDNIYVSCKGDILEIITPIGFTEQIDSQLSPRSVSFLESLDKFKASPKSKKGK